MEIEQGSEWVSGNTFYPTHSTVLGLRTWEQLTASQQKAWSQIDRYRVAELPTLTYVAFRVHGGVDAVSILSLDVFQHCYFRSWDEMFEAYEARRAS